MMDKRIISRRRSLVLVLAMIMVLLCIGCGTEYICYKCDKVTTQAYYTMDADKERVMCDECARSYWMPLPYKNYKVE